MLDSKKRLFVNISHLRDLTSHKISGRKALQVLNFSPEVHRDEEDELQDVCLDRVKDEEAEASEAALFFDQPTPVIEMKSFLTGLSKDSNQRPNQSFPDTFDHHMLQSTSFAHQSQQQSCLSSQSESLSTPVVDPNFTGPQFATTHTLANMEAAMYEPFQPDHTDILFRDSGSGMLDTSSGSYALQYATPPQFQQQYMPVSPVAPPTTDSQTTHLPESVMEIAHRPSISSVPASESSSSSQPASPKTAVPDLKRKRSDSEGGKKGRMTKKQQFDALCSRKTQLEEDNYNLREKVNGYERACKRLKELLYNRIRQQRA